MRYRYVAVDSGTGAEVVGVVDAADESSARERLTEQGLLAKSLSGRAERFVWPFVSQVEIADAWRSIASDQRSGFSFYETILGLANDYTGRKLGVVFSDVARRLGEGESFSHAIGAHRDVFGETSVALLEAGEVGGAIEPILERLASTSHQQAAILKKVRSALMTPAIMGIFAVAIVLGTLIAIIPKLIPFFALFNAKLPLLTQVEIGISEFLLSHIYIIPILLVAIGVVAVRLRRSPAARAIFNRIAYKTPVIKRLLGGLALSRVVSTFALMLEAGLSIPAGLRYAAQAAGSVQVAAVLREVADDVESGMKLTPAFSRGNRAARLPTQFGRLLRVIRNAEKNSTLPERMGAYADQVAEETMASITAMVPYIQTVSNSLIMILVTLIGVGALLPIFTIISSILKSTGGA